MRGIFRATDHARENSEDPEPSDKVPGIFEVEWGFRKKGAGHAGDRKISRGMLQQRWDTCSAVSGG